MSFFDKAPAGAFDCGAPNREGGSDRTVLYTRSGFEEDTGTGHFAGRVRSTMQQVCKLLAFIVSKRDRYFFIGIAGRPPVNRLTRLYPIDNTFIKFTMMGYYTARPIAAEASGSSAALFRHRSRRRPLSTTQHNLTTSLVGIAFHCNETRKFVSSILTTFVTATH